MGEASRTRLWETMPTPEHGSRQFTAAFHLPVNAPRTIQSMSQRSPKPATNDNNHRSAVTRGSPGGAKVFLSAAQARKLLASVRPRRQRPASVSRWSWWSTWRRSTPAPRPPTGAHRVGEGHRDPVAGPARPRPLRCCTAAGRGRRHHTVPRPRTHRLLDRHRTHQRLPRRPRPAPAPAAATARATGSCRLHIMAVVQLRNPTEARAYFDGKKASGKTSMEAMRCLKRRLSDLVHRPCSRTSARHRRRVREVLGDALVACAIRCDGAQSEEVADTEGAERAAEDCRNELQSLVPADEPGLPVIAHGASPLDLSTARGLEVPHPVRDRAVQHADHETIGCAERQHRGREVTPGGAPSVPDDRQRRQPSRDQAHNGVRDRAVEPSEFPPKPSGWVIPRAHGGRSRAGPGTASRRSWPGTPPRTRSEGDRSGQ